MKADDLWSFYPELIKARKRAASSRQSLLRKRKGEHVHFVFVEDVAVIANPQALEAPDHRTIRGLHGVFKSQAVRFRTSGPEAEPFLEAMNGFDRLEAGEATEPQRDKRRQQLLEFFDRVPLPTIDIYVSQRDAEYKSIRQALLPGSWCIAVFRDDSTTAGERPVIYGAPELPSVRHGVLRRLAPVAPPVELRLRDIFSLNHVRDAAMPTGGGEIGGGLPVVPPLDSPPLKGSGMEPPPDQRERVSVKSKRLRRCRCGRFEVEEPEDVEKSQAEVEAQHALQVQTVRIMKA